MRSEKRVVGKRLGLYLLMVLLSFIFLFFVAKAGPCQQLKETSNNYSFLIENGAMAIRENRFRTLGYPNFKGIDGASHIILGMTHDGSFSPFEPLIQKTEKIAGIEKIDVPVWEIGDTWVYRSSNGETWRVKVVRVESNLIVTESSRRGYFLGHDKNTLKPKYTIDQSGKRTKPTVPYVDFPLYVGKRWKQNVPSSIVIIREYKCFSNEDVMVRAGKLKAAKIKFIQTSIDGGKTTSGDAYIWYSPEVKNIVKIQFERTSYWARAQDIELISFKAKDKDVFLSEAKTEKKEIEVGSDKAKDKDIFLSQAEAEKKEIEVRSDEFSYLIENGSRMIRENDFEKVFGMISELSQEKKVDFRVRVIENFAYLKGYLVSKKNEYGKKWQIDYKPMVYTLNKTAISILLDLLKDNDPYIRAFTARALGYLGDHTALADLERLASEDSNQKVRSRAREGYYRISGKRLPFEYVSPKN